MPNPLRRPGPTLYFLVALSIASFSRAQGLRLTRQTVWTPDSVVKAVLTSGSARLTPDPPVDETIPRIWLTRAERTKWKQTSDYDETMRYCRQLEAGSRWVKVEPFGRTGQGRDLSMLIVSKDKLFTPEAARASGLPIVLVQNGIHSGEIEGKDASLMLVRDLAVLRQHEQLLDSVIVLVVPMFSADAHERRSRYNRINQNGPDEMGWRHTPIGLNLNRDYTKLDAPEMRALIGNVFTKWWPDLLVDDHTTDGADYRYDVTWAVNHGAGMPGALDRWCADAIEGGMVRRLTARGHLVAPYLDFRGGSSDPRAGIEYGNSTPRFSTGYAPLQARPALLVETHMLKPYGARVQATYDLLLSLLEEIHASPGALRGAVRSAEAEAIARARGADPARSSLVLSSKVSDRGAPFAWKGVQTTWEWSDITGSRVPRYSATPWDTTVMIYRETVPTLTVKVPPGYVVPQEWTDILDRLALHGIQMRRLARAWSDTVEMARVLEHTGSADGYEGRHNVKVAVTRLERQVRAFRPGDVWVPTDQRGGALIVNLLEAQAPDGFMAWGFFDTVFQKKEYGADYVVEPMARAMLAHDPALAAEFRARVNADTAFAKDPNARGDWFYRRSPWNDAEQDLHPIARALRPVPEAFLVPPATPAPATTRR